MIENLTKELLKVASKPTKNSSLYAILLLIFINIIIYLF